MNTTKTIYLITREFQTFNTKISTTKSIHSQEDTVRLKTSINDQKKDKYK